MNEKSKFIFTGLLVLGFFGFIFFNPKPSSEPVPQAVKVATPTAPPKSQNPIELPSITFIPSASASTVRASGLRVPVLMYHHVGPLVNSDVVTLDLTVSNADFEAQVVYFKSLGYQSVSLAQVYAAVSKSTPLPAKPIVFTFDDGYKDVFDNAVPILEKYGYTGTFAIATELLGRPTYAVWDDVIAAHNAGMEVISHSENHLDLTNPIYSADDLNREIVSSKQVLENKLGVAVDFFVYPYGRYNAKVEDLVKQAGYKMAFTTTFGLFMNKDLLLAEPRVRVHGGSEGLDKLKKIFGPGLQISPAQLSP